MDKSVFKEDVVKENFNLYWTDRDIDECFFGIAVLLHDEGYTGKEYIFDSSNPDNMPTIMLDGECWQVKRLRLTGKYEMELNLINNGITKKVCISDEEIEKFEAYKLLCAVFDNTEHEKCDGEDFEDVEDFYGWELS